jgi:hypothetical protein
MVRGMDANFCLWRWKKGSQVKECKVTSGNRGKRFSNAALLTPWSRNLCQTSNIRKYKIINLCSIINFKLFVTKSTEHKYSMILLPGGMAYTYNTRSRGLFSLIWINPENISETSQTEKENTTSPTYMCNLSKETQRTER